MWLLARLIPYLLSKHVAEEDEHWQNYLLMLHIAGFLLAPEITRDEVGYLQRVYTCVEPFQNGSGPVLETDPRNGSCSVYTTRFTPISR